ncbi:methylase [Lophiostoma macrostomum CBS 122681]|uniref:Methylase n=1 Tax=Lophiostoma macrostomum CBS 122681 TaxID=1314788 RepID=A0A6A6STY4_9PLEO|nr:methylase [Lophiostoma macrostomum CBS 122681]
MSSNTSVDPPGQAQAQAIHHELRNAENSAAFVLPKLQSMKESNPGLKLLDVGAGSGTITASFAKLLPDGHVTGLDLKAEILPRARTVAEIAGVKNVNFLQGDCKKLPFEDGTFDVVFCHQMLTHMPAPEDALREMLRVTKPGGIVAAREGDFKTEAVYPESPALLKFHKTVATMMGAAGGTETAGRQLLPWALKAGAERTNITLTFGTWLYVTQHEKDTWAGGLITTLKTGVLREKGVKAGLITEEECADMITAWESWAAGESSSISMMHGEIMIQK